MIQRRTEGQAAASSAATAAAPARPADFSAAVIQAAVVAAVSAAAAARTGLTKQSWEAYCFRSSTPCTPPHKPQKLVNISIVAVDRMFGKITRMRSDGASNNSVNPHLPHP